MATAAPAVPSGPAHVAVVSFLAARAAPVGGFWIALAGGVALARTAERRGARLGFGASIAAMLETVAIIGPARIGIPFTQAATAPMLGRLEARGWRPLPQILACGAIRLIHNSATTAFFIWVITGGLDAYAGTYDAIGRRLGFEVGTADALLLTLASLLVWAAFASTVQVLVYRRGLAQWDDLAADAPEVDVEIQRKAQARDRKAAERERRFDPRLLTLIAVVLFATLLATTKWAVLAAVAAFLVAAWIVRARSARCSARACCLPRRWGAARFCSASAAASGSTWRPGARPGPLCSSSRPPGCAAPPGRRAFGRSRAGRWLASGECPRRPRPPQVLDQIESEGRLAEAARTLERQLRGVERRPVALLDAVLRWVVREANQSHSAAGARADTSKL